VLTIVLLIGGFLLFLMLLQWRNILAVYLTQNLWLSGEYDRALGRLRWPIFRSPTPQILFVEGVVLSIAGRSAEAEQLFRRALGAAGSAPRELRTRALIRLGFALSDQGRYEESERCFEGVIAMGDKTGSARVGIAALLLKQGKEPERALALLEEVMKAKPSRLALPERMANKAWAYALMGRQQEMEEAMATAMRAIDPKLKVVVASVVWRIGKALVAVGRVPEAVEHFRTACQMDPRGHCGALARVELDRATGLGG
jgi:tetratricopeptide (TPR) repeat protein